MTGATMGTSGGAARSVFLSYARADATRAAAVAAALEALECAVWWDRKLDGGAAFAHEIERALDGADVVVVLWSAASVVSDWVRDEATVGRERGRLIPIGLDGTPPPLGFRQTHTLDLRAWNGDPADPILVTALKRALARPHAPAIAEEAALPPGPARPSPGAGKRRQLVGAGLLATAALAGLGWWWRPDTPPPRPTLAVLPFIDTSRTADGRAFSEGIAEEILNLLARDRRLSVLGRTSGAMLAARTGELAASAGALGVTHLLEGSVRSRPGRIKVSVRLIRLADGRAILAEDFDRRVADVFAVEDEIGGLVSARLTGALVGRGPALPAVATPRTTPEVYTRFLAARQLARRREAAPLRRAEGLLRAAVDEDPAYAPAWAALAEVSVLLAADQYGDRPVADAVAAAERYAVRAVALAPGLAASRAAVGMAAVEAGDPARAIAEFRRAVAADPNRPEYLGWLGYTLTTDGYIAEAATVMRRTVAIEPLWFRPRVTAMYALARTGDRAAIAALADSFVPLAPDQLAADRVAMEAAYRLARYGDAVRLARGVLVRVPGDTQARETLSEIGTILLAPALAAEGAIHATPVLTPALWDQPVAMAYASTAYAAAGRLDEWLASYRARFASPDEFFAGPLDFNRVVAAAATAAAMEAGGDGAGARRTRALAAARLQLLETRGLAPGVTASVWAMLLVPEGKAGEALARLEAGRKAMPDYVCTGPQTLDTLPQLAPLKTDRRFDALIAHCRAWLVARRAEIGRPSR